ncbi:MAG: hypothetical protein E7131_06030 [Rikenellaceae bacterium]|nr:hypothetical protein [Rikenellaceae bacterium]
MKKLFLLVLAIFSFHITYAQLYDYEPVSLYIEPAEIYNYQQPTQVQNIRTNAVGKDYNGSYVKVPIIVSIQGKSAKVTKYYSNGQWQSVPGRPRVEKCSSFSTRNNSLEGQYMYKASVSIPRIRNYIYFDL